MLRWLDPSTRIVSELESMGPSPVQKWAEFQGTVQLANARFMASGGWKFERLCRCSQIYIKFHLAFIKWTWLISASLTRDAMSTWYHDLKQLKWGWMCVGDTDIRSRTKLTLAWTSMGALTPDLNSRQWYSRKWTFFLYQLSEKGA